MKLITENHSQSLSSTLDSYHSLSNNWDEEGAFAPIQADLTNAFNFLALIEKSDVPEPIIGISSDGEINFVWDDKKSHIYIDIGFKNGGYSYYSVDINQQEKLVNEIEYNKDDLICLMEVLHPEVQVCR